MSYRLGKIIAIIFFCSLLEANAETNKKIDLSCILEGGVLPLRFVGVLSRLVGTDEEGTGTVKIDTERGASSNAVFRLNKGALGQGPQKLLVDPEPAREKDTKIVFQRHVYQIDRRLRIFSVLQDDPITSPVPLTEVLTGACWGIF